MKKPNNISPMVLKKAKKINPLQQNEVQNHIEQSETFQIPVQPTQNTDNPLSISHSNHSHLSNMQQSFIQENLFQNESSDEIINHLRSINSLVDSHHFMGVDEVINLNF